MVWVNEMVEVESHLKPLSLTASYRNAPKSNLSLGFELSEAANIDSLVGPRITNLFSDDDPLSVRKNCQTF